MYVIREICRWESAEIDWYCIFYQRGAWVDHCAIYHRGMNEFILISLRNKMVLISLVTTLSCLFMLKYNTTFNKFLHHRSNSLFISVGGLRLCHTNTLAFQVNCSYTILPIDTGHKAVAWHKGHFYRVMYLTQFVISTSQYVNQNSRCGRHQIPVVPCISNNLYILVWVVRTHLSTYLLQKEMNRHENGLHFHFSWA